VAGTDVVTVEAVVLCPGIKQQVRITRAQLKFTTLEL
jgi:hypothetical protein